MPSLKGRVCLVPMVSQTRREALRQPPSSEHVRARAIDIRDGGLEIRSLDTISPGHHLVEIEHAFEEDAQTSDMRIADSRLRNDFCGAQGVLEAVAFVAVERIE